MVRIGTSGALEYLHADERGSVMAISNSAGQLQVTHQYDVYGQPVDSNDSLFRYTGQIRIADTDLYHYKARAYHPGLGRFMQTDPIGYEDGMNLYTYGSNDPVNRVDPNGKTDIYIGGLNDSNTRIVRNYAERQATIGGRTVQYFTHRESAQAVAFARANIDNGEPLNVVGHSYGASAAVKVANALAEDGIAINNLVGVDGVSKPFQSGELSAAASRSVGNVVSVDSTGSGTRGDFFEGLGKVFGPSDGTPNAFKPSMADLTIISDTHHGDFVGALLDKGTEDLNLSAKDIIDKSYLE